MQELVQPRPWPQSIRHHDNLWQVLRSYYQLTKPRIIVLLLITTAAAMWVAGQGHIDLGQFLAVLVGGACSAAAANTINCLYDRDIDLIMERTQHRPLPSGRIRPRDAALFALGLAAIAFGLITWTANLLAASLAMAGIGFYVVIYTHWLKRHSIHNIVIGGAAGAIPPLVGWAAVTGDLAWGAWALFWIIVLWTPPHFWALALMIRDDYASVGVPMLPVVRGDRETAWQIWLYALALVPFTLVMVWPLHDSGLVYLGCAIALGTLLIQKSWHLLQAPSDRDRARSLFKYSIFYMMLLCAALTIDSLPVAQGVSDRAIATLQAMGHLVPMLASYPLS